MANTVVTPYGAIVMNVSLFQNIIQESLTYTEKIKAIVTIGIRPNRPETGYGYVSMNQLETQVASIRFGSSRKNQTLKRHKNI